MDCEDAMVLISSRIDREIDASEQARLSAHLADCPACAALSEALQLQDADLRHGFEPRRRGAAAVADRVLAQLQASSPSPAEHPSPPGGEGVGVRGRIMLPCVVFALTVTLALIGVVVWLQNQASR